MDNLSDDGLREAGEAVREPLFHAQSSSEVLRIVESRLGGLTADDAAKRLEAHGPNELPQAAGVHPVLRFLAQFNNALIYFLIAAAVATALLGQFVDTTVIVAVVIVNAIVGFIQEGRGVPSDRKRRSRTGRRLVRLSEPACVPRSPPRPEATMHEPRTLDDRSMTGERSPASVLTPLVVRLGAAGLLSLGLTSQADAHVKWFAPYIVGAPPVAIGTTLANVWFWLGIVLVLAFFVATRAVEKSQVGTHILDGMDRISDPLWNRLDDFVRVVIGAFFVAIFAVGGVYLTPDLTTPSEWVSWLQLLIAFGVFSKRTMPFSAAGIILLWVLALQDYDLFHLLDYLALGVAVAAYLVLASSSKPNWFKHRFEVLRWGVAIALMWSSLEKFAYPDWFYPLVVEKPFLTFGLPRDVFIPMAGVAEFTMGFGLLWTPLIRRLSAISLFVIFNAAVYPFGRIDMVGHALIMAIIVVIAADHTRELHFLPTLKKSLRSIPVGLATALVLFGGAYWGLHLTFYGADGRSNVPTAVVATHSFDPQHPHAAPMSGAGDAPPLSGVSTDGSAAVGAALPTDTGAATADYEATMEKMHQPMLNGMRHPDPDVAFVLAMIPHHQAAIDMARVQLKHGTDPDNRAFAEHVIVEQEREIVQMRQWLVLHGH